MPYGQQSAHQRHRHKVEAGADIGAAHRLLFVDIGGDQDHGDKAEPVESPDGSPQQQGIGPRISHGVKQNERHDQRADRVDCDGSRHGGHHLVLADANRLLPHRPERHRRVPDGADHQTNEGGNDHRPDVDWYLLHSSPSASAMECHDSTAETPQY
jgi:hypothetical protein